MIPTIGIHPGTILPIILGTTHGTMIHGITGLGTMDGMTLGTMTTPGVGIIHTIGTTAGMVVGPIPTIDR
jgi:hypothetical protein